MNNLDFSGFALNRTIANKLTTRAEVDSFVAALNERGIKTDVILISKAEFIELNNNGFIFDENNESAAISGTGALTTLKYKE